MNDLFRMFMLFPLACSRVGILATMARRIVNDVLTYYDFLDLGRAGNEQQAIQASKSNLFYK